MEVELRRESACELLSITENDLLLAGLNHLMVKAYDRSQ